MINIEPHINWKFDGQGTTFDDGQNRSNKKEKRRENPIPAKTYKKTEKSYFRTNFVVMKKCDFHFPWMFLITFAGRNDLAEVRKNKNNSNGTIVCDDDAHIVVLCTRSHFFSTRWVLLRLKKTTLKIQL